MHPPGSHPNAVPDSREHESLMYIQSSLMRSLSMGESLMQLPFEEDDLIVVFEKSGCERRMLCDLYQSPDLGFAAGCPICVRE